MQTRTVRLPVVEAGQTEPAPYGAALAGIYSQHEDLFRRLERR